MTKKGCPDIQFSIFMLEPPEITSNLRFQRARACTLDHDKSTSKIQKLRNFNFLLILGSESKNMLYIVGGSILWVFGVLSIKYGPKSFIDCRNLEKWTFEPLCIHVNLKTDFKIQKATFLTKMFFVVFGRCFYCFSKAWEPDVTTCFLFFIRRLDKKSFHFEAMFHYGPVYILHQSIKYKIEFL